jgi:ACR3 family arsenite transporter
VLQQQKEKLGFLDSYLTLCFPSHGIRIAIGNFIPSSGNFINSFQRNYKYSIAIRLILMMYPPPRQVKYEQMGEVFKNTKVLGASFSELGYRTNSYVLLSSVFS